jgi:hypothetical protein
MMMIQFQFSVLFLSFSPFGVFKLRKKKKKEKEKKKRKKNTTKKQSMNKQKSIK